MARDDSTKSSEATSPTKTADAAASAKSTAGGLKGLQANPDPLAQSIAFEINTGRAGDYAAKAIAKLTPEKLDALLAEAQAAKAETEDDAWSTLDYLRARYTAPVAIAYETRPVLA